MDFVFWVAIARLIAYGVLSPVCVLLGLDRQNQGRWLTAGLYASLGFFFLAVLIANVLDLVGERDALRVARMLVAPPAVAAAWFAVVNVVRGYRE